ncbi:MAG: serine protease [Pseudomonadota bacterium]
MLRRLIIAFFLTIFWTMRAVAQNADDIVFVQIEAQPDLALAVSRAQAYSQRLADVNGFAIGRGWHAIALGPYTRADANQVLRVYRAEGIIPRDSFIAFPGNYGQQFFPPGGDVLGRGVLRAPVPSPQPEPQVRLPEPSDETPNEARRSERNLTAEERKELQTALKWAGFYQGAIDGAYGRGTRNAMGGWQTANGFEATGILTTLQRTALIAQYNAVLEGLDLDFVNDTRTGISMKVPLGIVGFDRYEAPFAHFEDSSGPARVLLLSQRGTRDTLYGLYDVLQTLEIMPLEGPRERGRNAFSITGQGDKIVSEARVSLQGDEIKGYILVWPAGDEERRTRLLEEMDKSFTRIQGVLEDENAQLSQSLDLVAGLQVRRPRLSRSGFFVDPQGTVVTTSEAVQSCTRITLDDETEASIALNDPLRGVAVLNPNAPLSPLTVGRFSPVPPRLQSDVLIAGYSYEGILNAPTVTAGTLDDLRGLRGEAGLARLGLSALPGDAGGPVLDSQGGVLGMLLPRGNGARQLPEDVNFAADSASIADVLTEAGKTVSEANGNGTLDPVELAQAATGMTVLVSCWD